MKLKKLTTAVLASVMAFSAMGAITASAADDPTFKNDWKYVGIQLVRKHARFANSGARFSGGRMASNGSYVSFSGDQFEMTTAYVQASTTDTSGYMNGKFWGLNKTWYF